MTHFCFRPLSLLTLGGAFGILALSLPPTASAAPLGKPVESPAQCVSFTTEARFNGGGYNHLVHIKNACTRDVSCTVRTNVNPKPIEVWVPHGREKTVNTFLSSPAREFSASVSCRFGR